jgi:hypothetical protein
MCSDAFGVLCPHHRTEEPLDRPGIVVSGQRFPGVKAEPVPDRERVGQAVARDLRVTRRHLGRRSRKGHQLRARGPQDHPLQWRAEQCRIDGLDAAGVRLEDDPERSAFHRLCERAARARTRRCESDERRRDCQEKARPRLCPMQNAYHFPRHSGRSGRGNRRAGATGLEPATSGVTGVTKRWRLAPSNRLNWLRRR